MTAEFITKKISHWSYDEQLGKRNRALLAIAREKPRKASRAKRDIKEDVRLKAAKLLAASAGVSLARAKALLAGA